MADRIACSTRLKNIEETEKAKRVLTEERKERSKKVANDEEHLAAARCKSHRCVAGDGCWADILRQSIDPTSRRNPTRISYETQNWKPWDCSPKIMNPVSHGVTDHRWPRTRWYVLGQFMKRLSFTFVCQVMERFKKRMRK